jgi:hypothetical protein
MTGADQGGSGDFGAQLRTGPTGTTRSETTRDDGDSDPDSAEINGTNARAERAPE